MIVEDGTGAGNSYASEAAFETWCEQSAITPASGDVEGALVRGSLWIDARFGARYPGKRAFGRDQGLGWPRVDACDREGNEIPSDEVPVEIVRAACAAALRELASPGSLAPDVAGGGAVRRERIGSLEVEYANADGGRALGPSFPEIEGLLSTLIKPRGWTIPLVRA